MKLLDFLRVLAEFYDIVVEFGEVCCSCQPRSGYMAQGVERGNIPYCVKDLVNKVGDSESGKE